MPRDGGEIGALREIENETVSRELDRRSKRGRRRGRSSIAPTFRLSSIRMRRRGLLRDVALLAKPRCALRNSRVRGERGNRSKSGAAIIRSRATEQNAHCYRKRNQNRFSRPTGFLLLKPKSQRAKWRQLRLRNESVGRSCLKLHSEIITHKSDVDGVKLNLQVSLR